MRVLGVICSVPVRSCHPTLGPQAQEGAQHIPSHLMSTCGSVGFFTGLRRGALEAFPPLCTRSSCHLPRAGLDVCHLLAVRLMYPSNPFSDLHCCGRRQQHPIWTFPPWTGPALPLHGLVNIQSPDFRLCSCGETESSGRSFVLKTSLFLNILSI